MNADPASPASLAGGEVGGWPRWMAHGRLSSITGNFRAQRPTKKPNSPMVNDEATSAKP